ncbi:ATP-binding protein [Thauera mechernichensis]
MGPPRPRGRGSPQPLRAPADEDLHDLIAERYERAATIVTSNLDFTEWDQAFPGNRLLASATVDRLRHNAYCLTLDGASYRAPRQGPNRAKNALASTPKNIDSCPPNDVRQSLVRVASICRSSVALLWRSVTNGGHAGPVPNPVHPVPHWPAQRSSDEFILRRRRSPLAQMLSRLSSPRSFVFHRSGLRRWRRLLCPLLTSPRYSASVSRRPASIS